MNKLILTADEVSKMQYARGTTSKVNSTHIKLKRGTHAIGHRLDNNVGDFKVTCAISQETQMSGTREKGREIHPHTW